MLMPNNVHCDSEPLKPTKNIEALKASRASSFGRKCPRLKEALDAYERRQERRKDLMEEDFLYE